MFCRSCGAQNDDRAVSCSKCGAPIANAVQALPSGQTIPNYLVQSILVTVFCCWPFGIPAIVFAARVNSKQAAGDVAGALEASKKAKMWIVIALCGWGVAMLLSIGFAILAAVIDAMDH